jgi:hypothetical protein
MDITRRHNVAVPVVPTVFAHGFGRDQPMWCLVAPRLEDQFQVVRDCRVIRGFTNLDRYCSDSVPSRLRNGYTPESRR